MTGERCYYFNCENIELCGRVFKAGDFASEAEAVEIARQNKALLYRFYRQDGGTASDIRLIYRPQAPTLPAE